MASKKIFKGNQFSHIFMLFVTASAPLQANPFWMCYSHKIQNDVYNPSAEMERRSLDLKSLNLSANLSAATSKESIGDDNQEKIFSPRLNQNKTTCNDYYNYSEENLAQLAIDEANKSIVQSNQVGIFYTKKKSTNLQLVALRIHDYKNENYKYIN